MGVLSYISASWLLFIRHLLGLAIKPYSTVRTVVDKGIWGELWIVVVLATAYLAFSSLLKTQTLHPLLLTKQFVLLSIGALGGYLLIVGILSVMVLLQKQKNLKIKGVAVAWGYSLIPTGVWFFITSFLYVVLPPPRTESGLGVVFSLVYLTMSAVLFFWKAELYYLVLRFGLRLDLAKIILLTAIILPTVGVYSVIMLYLEIFRVPFI